ncbi:MAG TPA: response regulator [Polyangiaceae bacterium]|nr:response regulator [Polyangiaceae bacterium]
MHILLVEDNPVDVVVIRERLEAARLDDLEVTQVESLAALRDLKLSNVTLALVDLSLEDSHGLDSLNRLKGILEDVPIIVLTSDDNESVAFEALRQGAQDYLLKGAYSADTMRRAIRYAIERHNLKRHLMHADRLAAVGKLAAGVAHEVSNPATFVLGNSVFLDRHLTKVRALVATIERAPEKASAVFEEFQLRSMLDEIARLNEDNMTGMDRITRVVRELQQYSRLARNRVRMVDVNEIIRDSCKLVRNSLRHRARLEVELSDVPLIAADPAKLEQMLTNLFVNASHAIVEGGPDENFVRIASEVCPGGILVSVSDSGCGIPEDQQKEIFGPFFTTKPRDQGTGLGLALAADIVRLHSGSIDVQSDPRHGTTFRIFLPSDTGLMAEVSEPVDSKPKPLAPPGRVLVVDDEVNILKVYEQFLSEEHEVVAMQSSVEALELLKRDQNFGVIVCDFSMPGLDGPKLHELVRDFSERLAARFVFCTGGAVTDRAEAFAEDGRFRLLYKPFRPSDLLEVVNEQLKVAPAP